MYRFGRLAVLIILIVVSCRLKTKTELYLERGLDILRNKKAVNFTFTEGVQVEEVGVIRDQKENKKTLVLKLIKPVDQDFIREHMMAVEAEVVEAKKLRGNSARHLPAGSELRIGAPRTLSKLWGIG